jgi:hypothetical protein
VNSKINLDGGVQEHWAEEGRRLHPLSSEIRPAAALGVRRKGADGQTGEKLQVSFLRTITLDFVTSGIGG